MASAVSPVPKSNLDLPSLLIALAVVVFSLLALAALHFLLKRLRGRAQPVIPEAVVQACRGIDQKVLDSIPVQAFDKTCKFLRLECQCECSVCLSGLEKGEMVRILPSCGHVFHVQCIDAWFASHSSCPFCRSEITAAAESFVLPVGGSEEFDGALNQEDGELHRSNSLVCPSGPRLMSFREKLRLKRGLSLDSVAILHPAIDSCKIVVN